MVSLKVESDMNQRVALDMEPKHQLSVQAIFHKAKKDTNSII